MKTVCIFLTTIFCSGVFAQPVSVPFEYYQSLIYIPVAINGKENLRFLVNTGANASVIDTRTAADLGLQVFERDSVVGTVGREAVDILRIKDLKIGGMRAKSLPITRRDLSTYIAPGAGRLDGVLGTDFLADYAVTIDYNKKQLRIEAPKKRPAAVKTKEKSIPFTLEDGTPTFVAKLNDTAAVSVCFNSGVSLAPDPLFYINISEGLWRKLKRRTPGLAPVRHLSARGVGGTAYLPVIPISGMAIGAFRVLQPLVVVQPNGGYFTQRDTAGFFGNNFFEKFQKITIDFPGRVVTFQPPKSYGAYLYEEKSPVGNAPATKRRSRSARR